MKAQAIEKLLIGLCNNFFASITDEKLREEVRARIDKKLELLKRKQEIEKGEII